MGLVAQNGIPHIIIMGYLYFIKQNHVLQLRGISHYSPFAHNSVSPDESAVAYLGLFSDNSRPVDIGGGRYRSALCHPHIFSPLLIFRRVQGSAQLQNKGADFRQKLPGIDRSLKKIFRDCLIQIV